MSKKKRIPDKYQIWIDVRKRYRLSDVKSIEEILRTKEKKKEEQRKRKQLERESKQSDQKAHPCALEIT
jgi:hypothetical protein